MKNREYKKLLAVALMVAMVGSMTGTGCMQVKAADAAAKATKTETVYAKIDANGSVKNVEVSDQLKNVTDQTKIDDQSNLSDIQNLKGNEEFKKSSDSLVWTGDGKDIVYSGTGEASELPVGVKITYTLDGKEVSVADLEGKSGHLTIRYDYENLSKSRTGSFVPFLVATGIVADGSVFTNVTATNAKIMSDGDRDLVIGYGFPGVADELDVTDTDIPDYFEMDADVTDYTAPQSITIGTNEVFNDIDTDKIDSVGELKDAMTQLGDASNQLVSGSGELKTGLDTLLNSSGTLVDGVDQLASGGSELASGVSQLSAGSQTLASGADQLSAGSQTLANGANDLASGTTKLAAGTAQLHAKASELATGAGSIAMGASALNSGVDTAAAGVNQLAAKLAPAQQGIAALDASVNASGGLTSSIQTLEGYANALNAALGSTSKTKNVTLNGTATMTGEVTVTGDTTITDENGSTTGTATVDNTANNDATRAVVQGLVDAGELTPEAAEAITNTLQDSVSEETTVYGSTTASGEASLTDTVSLTQDVSLTDEVDLSDETIAAYADKPTAGQLAAGIYSGLQSMEQSVNAVNGAGTLGYSIAALNQGLNSDQLNNGIAALQTTLTDDKSATTLKGGAAALAAGTKTLNENVPALTAGVTDLDNGAQSANAGAAKVSAGAKEVSSNLAVLSSGAGTLSTNLATADSGASALSTGILTLQEGTPELVSGITKLDDGAAQLNRGMIEFDETGIDQLTSAFGDNLDGLFDKLNTMLDSSESYKNFSGLSDQMDGSVKFVFITDAETK